jgi:hypothetical protein
MTITRLANSLSVIRLANLVVLGTVLALASCGGDQYVPEKVPRETLIYWVPPLPSEEE